MKKYFIYGFFILAIVSIASFAFYECYFLRNPERVLISDTTKFLSPANGTIVAIEHRNTENIPVQKKYHEAFSTFTHDVASSGYMISIMMTPMNVHYQRAPLTAKLISKKYTDGKFLNAMKNAESLNATFENEHNELLFETENGFRFKVIQIAGVVARRIVDFVEPDAIVTQGSTIGLIKLGSQVTVLVPNPVHILVEKGDVVVDGETVLLELE